MPAEELSAEEALLAECEKEPIHIPGSIQPHGVLLAAAGPNLEVVVESANAAETIGGGSKLRGRRLDEILDEESRVRLRRALADDPRDANPLEFELPDGPKAYALVHRSEGLVVCEIEPAGTEQVSFRVAYQRLIRRFDRLRRAETLDEVSTIAAREIQRLTGFDRTMVYRFDARFNGQVIAEERVDDDLEPFLGLHYPASDIPPQARRLYIENPIRLIVDSAYEAVPIVPDVNPVTGKPVDLSQSSLRSVSPVHCEYLRNMGVGASMSISLVIGDQLWGLVACHHRRPYHVPFGTRLVAEFIAHVLSARVSELDRLRALTRKTVAYGVQTELIDEMISAPRFQDGLAGPGVSLIDLVECDGAAVLHQGEVTRIGETPTVDQIRELGASADLSAGEVLATDHLGSLHPPAASYADRAAGCIAVPISADASDLLLWFRRERLRDVTWAGNPDKSVIDDGGPRLRPRGSFAAWVQEVKGQSAPWEDWEVEVASDFRTALAASVIHQAAELERMNARLMEASRHKDRFLATVSHELRNPLNAIKGWIHIARIGLEGAELDHALATIERNAEAQAELINDLLDIGRIEGGKLVLETRPLDLAEVVANALDSVRPSALAKEIDLQVELEAGGTDIVGDPRRLQQVVWNLVSNAIKFTPEGGRIEVDLRRRRSNVTLTVEDDGKGIEPELLPHVFEAFRQGQGSERMGLGLGLSIVKSLVELHGGRISVESGGAGAGSRFAVVLPVAALSSDVEAVRQPEDGQRLAETRILVAEDHEDAARMVAALLSSHGAKVETAANGAEALAALRDSESFDLLISDLDMPELDGYGLVGAMRREPRFAEVPAIALTAFIRGGDRARTLKAGFQHHVAKPVDPDELIAVVASLLGRLR